MKTKYITLTYDRADYKEYSIERAALIRDGGKMVDENLIKTALIVDVMVTGTVVFKKRKWKLFK